MRSTERRFKEACERFEELGVSVGEALSVLSEVPLSIHCWQGDDVRGFEGGQGPDGGIQVTGDHPGRARNFDELAADLTEVLSLVPGRNKVNLHASYRTSGRKTDRDGIEPEDFAAWADFAVERGIGLDFNPTFFAHPLSSAAGTLTCADEAVRTFWVEHGIRCRWVAAFFARRTGRECVNNLWIPDGSKEVPVDTMGPRVRLKDSLDRILSGRQGDGMVKDAVESKLFGIGSEAYVAGSHEFYLEYAASRKERDVMVTLDTGHFHPTETVSGKLSALLLFCPQLMIHLSRPVRWDSDHVVTLDDETNAVFRELVRLDALGRVYLSLDYFDGSVNRILAWAVGARNAKKALLHALLQPLSLLREMEEEGNLGGRLAILEEWKTLPFQEIWDRFCEQEGVLPGFSWIGEAQRYEENICRVRE